MRLRISTLAVAALLPAAISCSSTNGAGPGGDGDGGGGAGASADGGVISCDSQGLTVDTYEPGMKKVGKAGIFTFILESASPAPPASAPGTAGDNTWQIKVVDASGNPVPNVVFTLPANTSAWPYAYNPYMPKHGHGTSVQSPDANVPLDSADGTATIMMDYFMSGVWWTYIQADDGTHTDGAVFAFCTP